MASRVRRILRRRHWLCREPRYLSTAWAVSSEGPSAWSPQAESGRRGTFGLGGLGRPFSVGHVAKSTTEYRNATSLATVLTIDKTLYGMYRKANLITQSRRRRGDVRIGALVKQIPAFEEMELAPDGRLRREGLDLEMNPYCRRGVAAAVDLASRVPGTHECVFITLGPPTAGDVLREALAWADARGVHATGVLVTDTAFAGSDTLATARALAAALRQVGPFDLVFSGRSSVDADTGQVGPQLAQLLGMPFLAEVRELQLADSTLHVKCEQDDTEVVASVGLPAICSAAERLIDPCKVDASDRSSVRSHRIRSLGASDLGPGPWGQAGSPTYVGNTRLVASCREGRILAGDVDAQVRTAVEFLSERGALVDERGRTADKVEPTRGAGGDAVMVIVEPDRPRVTRELLGAAARLATGLGGHVVAVRHVVADDLGLGSWGADVVVDLEGAELAEDVARGVVALAGERPPWAVLAPSTAWGREVAGRVAAVLGAGLTGDAIELDVADRRLVSCKPAFGGQLVVAIHTSSPTQMATVRVGVLPLLNERPPAPPVLLHRMVGTTSRVRVHARTRLDDLDVLAEARAVIGVGRGVDPDDYLALERLRLILGAELGATRKVTDNGWLPHSRQIGITGRSIAPQLFVSIGASGRFNHMVGVRSAGTILAINGDRSAPVFDAADLGIVGKWQDVVPALVDALGARVADPEDSSGNARPAGRAARAG